MRCENERKYELLGKVLDVLRIIMIAIILISAVLVFSLK
jgi:hypothetical protein